MKLNIHFLLIQTYVHANHAIKRANTDKPLVWGDVPMRDSEKNYSTQFHNFHLYVTRWGQSSLLQIYSNCSDQRLSVRIVLHTYTC